MITSQPAKINKVEVIPGVSDHDIPLVEVDVSPTRRRQPPRSIPLYGKADWDSIRKELDDIATKIISGAKHKTANQLWLMFKDTITEAIKKYVPFRTCKSKESLPYMTTEIAKLIRKRDRAFKQRKKGQRNFQQSTAGYQTVDQKVKELKKEIQKKLRTAYWDYIEDIITPMGTEEGTEYNGMKKFWRFIKSGKKDFSGITSMKGKDGITTEDPEKMANMLNDNFDSVFQNEEPLDPDLLPATSPHPTMDDIEITEPGVRKMLLGLKPHKAMGPDQVGPRVLKELAPTISPILTAIFRRSYETGVIPDDWRRANVVAVHKKGRKCDATNYRPISLMCVCCKLMEHVVASGIMKHARTNNLLYDLQHGFRERRSCETQLLGFQADILKNMADGKQTDAVVLDFSKAFDKVSHSKLVAKLGHYGVRGRTNAWIRDFLTDRKQTVVLNGASSCETKVRSGVPQGSVLGPCLFLFYINDLPEGLRSEVRLFADDTVVYISVSLVQDAETLQRDLAKLEEWEKKWGMQFHPGKCQVIIFTRKRKPIRHTYMLHGQALENVKEAKYLGVTFQEDMKFTTHIDNISASANRSLGFIKRNLRINSTQLKTTAYKALVCPLLEYAPTVWDPHTQKGIKQVEKVQRRAARYVQNRYRNQSSPTDMINELRWITLEERRRQQRLNMMYKMTFGHVAVDTAQYLIPKPPNTRSSRLNHAHSYVISQTNTDYQKFAFFPRTARDWNDLPSHIVGAETASAFRARLARHAASE